MWRTDNDALAFKWVMVNMAISAVAVNMLERKNGRARRETARMGYVTIWKKRNICAKFEA